MSFITITLEVLMETVPMTVSTTHSLSKQVRVLINKLGYNKKFELKYGDSLIPATATSAEHFIPPGATVEVIFDL